jgi:phage shock protein A
MSKKTELINLFKEFKNRYETVQAQVEEIRKNIAYTEIGREQAIKQLLDGFTPTVQLYHDKAIAAIDQGLEGLAKAAPGSSLMPDIRQGYPMW